MPNDEMTENIDLLFVHVPKFSGYYRPYGKYMTVNLLPMGTWVLADLAARRGYDTRILHLGLEWIETGSFSALPYLENKKIRAVAIPLHWHQQSYNAIETARKITGARIPAAIHPQRQGDPAVLVANSELAKSEMGWQPEFSELESIIESAWQWQRKHPHGYSD